MSASAGRQVFYGVAAAAGLVLTWYFNLTYDGSTGYVQAWFANAASSSAAVDLLVLAAAVSIFVVTEGRRLGMRWPLAYVVAGLVVAMAFAVPLFLLVRERALHARRGDG
ncbi:DUF2834 domain-containing protein [Kineococcus rubinsiae]|uniref:DUF2834 domain-containing protein n=1 Tax=Kineococcus rubinsiae TaxID=2609562 RepID=UPI0014306CF9|nr:DUF2834 domain-containing protein [Kineococcus rubinsiae]